MTEASEITSIPFNLMSVLDISFYNGTVNKQN